jgi:hypothetical protein
MRTRETRKTTWEKQGKKERLDSNGHGFYYLLDSYELMI